MSDYPCYNPNCERHYPKTKEKPVAKTKTLKITSCLNCPHHGFERDPSSHDSFDWQDDALVCYKARKSKYVQTCSDLGGYEYKAPARIIVGASRNAEAEYKRNKVGIPDWCPL